MAQLEVKLKQLEARLTTLEQQFRSASRPGRATSAKHWESRAALVKDLRRLKWAQEFKKMQSKAQEEVQREAKRRGKRRGDTLYAIAKLGVGGSTYRSFQRNSKKPSPSKVFREWAAKSLKKNLACRNRSALSRKAFEKLHLSMASRLRTKLNPRLKRRREIGAFCKLVDLLLKEYWLVTSASRKDRDGLGHLLHVPLDKYTLQGIAKFCPAPKIDPTASMKFAENRRVYFAIQAYIRRIAKQAGVPPIAYDLLAWNKAH